MPDPNQPPQSQPSPAMPDNAPAPKKKLDISNIQANIPTQVASDIKESINTHQIKSKDEDSINPLLLVIAGLVIFLVGMGGSMLILLL